MEWYMDASEAQEEEEEASQRMTSACGWMLTLPADATKRMQTEASSQLAMFIVDAVAMFQSEGAFAAVRDALVERALDLGFASRLNKVGLLLYATSEEKGVSEEDAQPLTYWMADLVAPSLAFVQDMAAWALDDLQATCGAARPEDLADGLRAAVQAACNRIDVQRGKASRAAATLVVVTGDPEAAGRGALSARTFRGETSKVDHVMVCPAAAAAGAFADSGFWADVQKLPPGHSEHGLALSALSLARLDEGMAARWPVSAAVRGRTVQWQLSEDIALPLQATAAVAPFKLPPHKYLDATTGREVASDVSWVHPATGAAMEPAAAPFVATDLEKMAEFTGLPPMAVLPTEAAAKLRRCAALGAAHPSLRLLGFYPRAALQLHHQVQPSKHLTAHIDAPPKSGKRPDKDTLDAMKRASDEHRRLFMCLWLAMQEQDLVALCTYTASQRSAPRLAALVHQDSQFDDHGAQTQPDALELRLLPYTDEVRFVAPSCQQPPPAMLPAVARARAAAPAEAAAAALVDALTDEAVTLREFRGPEAAYAKDVLRAQALDQEPPERSGYEAGTGYLTRRAAAAPVPDRVYQGFLDVVLGGTKLDADATAPGKKRAAPAAAAPRVSDAEVVAHVDWKNLVKTGALKSKTIDMLKQYLRHHKMSTAGRKAELLERVSQHATGA